MKYMTWTEGTYYECNRLLERWQIRNLLEAFTDKKLDQYVTIQDYDSEGNVIGCPLFFDIDAPSLLDAYTEMQSLVDSIYDQYEVMPVAWFSGGKGFHVIAPLYIRHPRCHEIAHMIWQEHFNTVECDKKVYRTRSMLRVENTWNIKGERYKIPVNHLEPLHTMVEMAKHRVQPTWHKSWRMTDLEIDGYISRLPEIKPMEFTGSHNFNTDMMPCLKNLWALPVPPEGERHELAYLMIRHCFRSELDQDQATALFQSHPFWAKVEANDYEKIIRSVYQNGRAVLGCKDNQLLQANCVKLCKYNKGMSITDTFKREQQ